MTTVSVVQPSAPLGRPREATGSLKIEAGHPGILAYLDGREVGELPQRLLDLSPGLHHLRFVGGDRLSPAERDIEVEAGVESVLGPIRLEVARGIAVLQKVTPGVRVNLVPSQGLTRTVTDEFFKDNTVNIDFDMSKGIDWSIEVMKPGYDSLVIPVRFEPGQPRRVFRLALHPRPSATAGASPTKARLNLASIPPSRVLLNGRPLGQTPLAGVEVAPGTYTIEFSHPKRGTKTVSVTLRAGETKGVGVRFQTESP